VRRPTLIILIVLIVAIVVAAAIQFTLEPPQAPFEGPISPGQLPSLSPTP
jgi:hypothetical protein